MNRLKKAIELTLPVCLGYVPLGAAFGVLLSEAGYGVLWSLLSAASIYAGSMQYMAVSLLTSGAGLLTTALTTFVVNARHLFYGVSMLEKYRRTGWMKPYLIYGLIDESFSLNCAVEIPDGVDPNWFYFFVTLLNHIYWIAGSCLGNLLGNILRFDTTGIDFVMTALFVVLFINQWKEAEDHRPALAGVGFTVLSLLIFGSESFMLPAMAAIIVFFLFMMRKEARA